MCSYEGQMQNPVLLCIVAPTPRLLSHWESKASKSALQGANGSEGKAQTPATLSIYPPIGMPLLPSQLNTKVVGMGHYLYRILLYQQGSTQTCASKFSIADKSGPLCAIPLPRGDICSFPPPVKNRTGQQLHNVFLKQPPRIAEGIIWNGRKVILLLNPLTYAVEMILVPTSTLYLTQCTIFWDLICFYFSWCRWYIFKYPLVCK